MKVRAKLLIAWAALSLLAACQTPPPPGIVREAVAASRQPDLAAPRPRPRVVAAWYPSWATEGRAVGVERLPADVLSQIHYAFIGLAGDGRLVLPRGGEAQLKALRERFPGQRLVLTVGGEGSAAAFSAILSEPAAQARFVEAAGELLLASGFDGLELDWEYPAAAERAGLVGLLVALREGLPGFWLGFCAAPTAARLEALDLAAMGDLLDGMVLMAYDFHGPWEPSTGHHSAPYADPLDPAVCHAWQAARSNAASALGLCLAAGFPPEKLILGSPLYGRAWYVAEGAGAFEGRFQPAAGRRPPGSHGAGSYDSADLARAEAWPPALIHHDPVSAATWFWDPADGLFVSFDDERTVKAKARLVASLGLAGMAFWQIAADPDARLPRIAAEEWRREVSLPDRFDATMEPTGDDHEPAVLD